MSTTVLFAASIEVTREYNVPCPTTAAVEPFKVSEISSRHRRPRIAACARDSLLGGTKAKFPQARRSSALYSGCGMPDSSADHSLRQGRFRIRSPNEFASRVALSMLRRKGLAKTTVGRFAGHARARSVI